MKEPEFDNPNIDISINHHIKDNSSNFVTIDIQNFNTNTLSEENHYGMILYDGSNSNIQYPVLIYTKNIEIEDIDNVSNDSSKNNISSSIQDISFNFTDIDYDTSNNISLKYYFKNILDNSSSKVNYDFSLNFNKPKMKTPYSFDSSYDAVLW